MARSQHTEDSLFIEEYCFATIAKTIETRRLPHPHTERRNEAKPKNSRQVTQIAISDKKCHLGCCFAKEEPGISEKMLVTKNTRGRIYFFERIALPHSQKRQRFSFFGPALRVTLTRWRFFDPEIPGSPFEWRGPFRAAEQRC